MFELAAAVHTTGINLEGWAATVGSLTITLGGVFAMVGWAARQANRDDTRKIVKEESEAIRIELGAMHIDLSEIRKHLSGLDTRVAKLEGVEEGKRFIMAQQTHSDQAPR
jgi:hypothetical protein